MLGLADKIKNKKTARYVGTSACISVEPAVNSCHSVMLS